jgi:hypothetical protein
MTTTLSQETTRAADPAFQALVRAAVWQLIPDIIGETVGTLIADGTTLNVPLTQAMIDKRHGFAVSFMASPDFWAPKVAAMLAGEAAVRAVDPPAMPADNVIVARTRACINALAGVKAGD